MKIKNIIFAICITSLTHTELTPTTTIKRFRSTLRSTYKTVHSDIRSLLSGKKLTPEQKKRIVFELTAGAALVIITGGTIWVWWVRPLQNQLQVATNVLQEIITIHLTTTTKANDDEIIEIIRRHPATVQSIMLHLASKRNDCQEVISALIQNGIPVDTKNNNGETPLHCAASAEQEGVVELLLEKGANPTITNNDGQKPSDLATDTTIQNALQQAEQKWRQSHQT